MARIETHKTAFEGHKGFISVASLETLAEVMPAYHQTYYDQTYYERYPAWYGNVSAKDCYRNVLNSNPQYLKDVAEMASKLESTINVETMGYQIDTAVVGFVPDVPSAIQNLPECMINMEPTQADFAPITIWASIAASAGISADAITKRGATICTLIEKIQPIRPVTLNLVLPQQGRGTNDYLVIPFPTMPLDMGSLSYALCSPGFLRHMWGWFVAERHTPEHCPWEILYHHFGDDANNPEYQRISIGLLEGDTEHDVYIPILHLYDHLQRDPVAWIESRLQKYLKE